MQKDKQDRENLRESTKPGFAGTDPKKVKKEIDKDISEGQGAMTSRQAGSMRD
ncbi:hypothetical protein [Virgibacillus sp. JSM 102003]|uniref:hypothetical protein n=1 Tax=Virgibacillus sp. JSM 102003 TaxID=1562108 RepID=UPI0035BF23CB